MNSVFIKKQNKTKGKPQFLIDDIECGFQLHEVLLQNLSVSFNHNNFIMLLFSVFFFERLKIMEYCY